MFKQGIATKIKDTRAARPTLGARIFRTRMRAWLIVLTIALLGSPVMARATEVHAGLPTASDYLPAAALVDQAGHPFAFGSLRGKPVLVGFIHASCAGVCEMLTAKMKSVAHELDPSFSAKVTMVSVTTDPKEDGPAQLTTYAKAQGAVGPGWIFLTGKREQVARVLKVYNVPEGDPGDELTHVLVLYLIGADGRELHQYNGTAVAAVAVAADIRSALARR
jgi:cytochrome oxidase Cu insertion factor (SCO1/SenC/PrrC family)